jgi:glyoxylase-like metal-dependent hydrolase (beta-lactamase superfamily II)
MRVPRSNTPLGLGLVVLLGVAVLSAAPQPKPTFTVSAVRFGTLTYPVRNLIAGGEPGRTIDLAMMVWLLRGSDGRVVLVDAGFYRDRLVQRWKPADFQKPSDAVAAAGVPPEQVTDIIISHIHWDHMDGVDLFPRARVWVQREEYEYYVADDGTPKRSGIEPEDAAMLARLRAEGRVTLVDGDAKELFPGVTVYTGGKHTFASQYVGVRSPAGTVIIASDNVYLYENLDRRVPIAQTLDAASNVAAQARMLSLVTSPRLIVPGHDPAVFTRFPLPGKGVARIE